MLLRRHDLLNRVTTVTCIKNVRLFLTWSNALIICFRAICYYRHLLYYFVYMMYRDDLQRESVFLQQRTNISELP